MNFLLCFFFSSRRRHTRWPRDWSSDVCSSDLIFPVDLSCSARLREAGWLSKRFTLKLKLRLILSAREEEQEGNNHVERASKGHWFFNLFSSAEYSADVSVLIDVHPLSNSVYSVVRNMVQDGPMERVDGHLSELHPFADNRFK